NAYDHDLQSAVVNGGFVYDIQSFGALWRTDGTPAGTTLQNDFDSRYGGVRIVGIAWNSFYLTNPSYGGGGIVFSTDGQEGATHVASIPLPRTDVNLISLNGKSYYFAAESTGDTLYRLDPGLGSLSGKVILNSPVGKLPLGGYRVYIDTNNNGALDS